MAVINSMFNCDLSKAVRIQQLDGNVFSLDNNGNRISVYFFDGESPAIVSGSVTANCILADESTVNVNGTLALINGQSVAYVDIPQGVLLIPGILKITIKLTDGSTKTTVCAIITNIYRTQTDNVITPSQQIIDDWNKEISFALGQQNATISALLVSQAQLRNDLNSEIQSRQQSVGENTEDIAELTEKKVNLPVDDETGSPTYGENGQVLRTKGDGTTEWIDPGTPTPEQVETAVENWLDDHPEATTTVEDDSITPGKLTQTLRDIISNINSRPSKMGVSETLYYQKSRIMGEYAEGDYALQGCEYNPNSNKYVFCFAGTDTETIPIIVETDNTFTYIRAVEVPDGGHLNDITYNPNDDVYYAVTNDANDQVICIDASTLETLSVVVLPSVPGIVSRISYDTENDVYYIYTNVAGTNNYIYKINSDFTEKTLLYTGFWNAATKNLYTETPTVYGQGSTVYNGRFVCLFWFGFDHNPGVTRLVFMNKKNTGIDFYFDFESSHIYDESETVINVGGVLVVPSYYGSKINIVRVSTTGQTDENLNNIFKENLQKQTFVSTNPTLLDDLGISIDENSLYKCWVSFSTNPTGIIGEQGLLFGAHYNTSGFQMLAEPSHFYYRKLNNNAWSKWHDILLNPRETTENILSEALLTYPGGVNYLRYMGTDYSWLPFQSSLFRYALFTVEYCFSMRMVTAVNVQNNVIARNMYINGAWLGWTVDGIFESSENVLTIANNIVRGKYTVRYIGSDYSWLPDSSFVYGFFDVENISSNVCKVTAYSYNGAKMATNVYVNNAWQGWKKYLPAS